MYSAYTVIKRTIQQSNHTIYMRQILLLLLLAAPLYCHAQLRYDETGPDFCLPTLERAKSQDYDPSNKATVSVWCNQHSVATPKARPSKCYAIWCTKDATYLATIFGTDYTTEPLTTSREHYIEDCDTGEKYYIKHYIGYPTGESFLLRTLGEEHVMIVGVYPPLPPTCTTISTGGAGPKAIYGKSSKYISPIDHVSITTLQNNQPLMKRVEVVVVY